MRSRITEAPAIAGRHRRLNRFWWWTLVVYSSLAVTLAVNDIFYLKIAGFMPIGNGYYYYLIALFLPLVYIIFPANKSAPRDKVPWYDCFLFLLCFVTALFFAVNAYNILWQGWDFAAPTIPAIFSIILWGLVLEGARRTAGLPLTIICAVFSIYPLFAGSMPGFMEGFSFSFPRVASLHAMSQDNIIGIPMRTIGRLIIGFMLFGVALQYTGGGRFFLSFSSALLGHARGGPAKVAVVASGLFGSISGAAISNVLTTGSVTIPTMKRVGYPPEFAAATEAVASTGGALMPPIMGAVAFIMASFLGVPYAEIVIAAVVPALLYYLTLFVQVDGYAARTGLRGLPRSELPAVSASLKEGWFYIFAMFALVYFLLVLRLEARAPFYATALLLGLAMIRKDTRFTPKSFLEFIAGVGRFMAELTAMLAAVGLILGSLAMTGVAASFSGELILLAGGSVILMLFLGAIASTILGMGMTISACYIFLAVILAPALIKVGIIPMAAHLFILYWGLVSYLTPPVALSAITAASIAQSKPMRTGFLSMRLAGAIYIVPFFFVFNPALLLIGSFSDIIVPVLTVFVGIVFLGYGLVGYLPKLGSLGLITRLVVLAGGLLLAWPEWYSNLAGLAMLAILFLYFFGRRFLSQRSTLVKQE